MSRLFKVAADAAAIAAHFDAAMPEPIGVPTDTVEGSRGLIVHEAGGRRVLRALPWGFPRLTREMRDCGDPPARVGLVADLTNPLWESLVAAPHYRCLIPVTHFANPAGRAKRPEPGSPSKAPRSWHGPASAGTRPPLVRSSPA